MDNMMETIKTEPPTTDSYKWGGTSVYLVSAICLIGFSDKSVQNFVHYTHAGSVARIKNLASEYILTRFGLDYVNTKYAAEIDARFAEGRVGEIYCISFLRLSIRVVLVGD